MKINTALLQISCMILLVIITLGCISSEHKENDRSDEPEDQEESDNDIFEYSEEMVLFEIKLSQDQYLINDTIHARVSVINNFSKEIFALPISWQTIDINFINPENETFSYEVSDTDDEGIPDVRNNDTLIELGPGENNSVKQLYLSSMYDFSSIGMYWIEIIYDAREPGEITQPYWNFRVNSTISIEIMDNQDSVR